MEKKKVLMVDDEVSFLQMAKMNLEETQQYEVLTLSSAKNIIETVHAFNPDIIVLDLIMPSLGGLEACQMLNTDPQGKRIPIIILSALGKEADKLKAYKLGIVDYLVKPITSEELIAAITKCLRYK
ncbi:MAG: response regulator [Candidatus Omnitrophica bacterium]|nr:response regulator [Candidatus Omnitrophota bacterium]MBU4478322.1 response regulator [Candidatus Omnitrophota bacterium]MCG2704250.1 response regulator [Candidatus Omnitrophota bacterium]